MKGWHAEIQVRTTAQHIWAAASHTLQYKQEGSVPAPMRRAIHRVSALLEMVDLEERASYRDEAKQFAPDATLNVDLIENALDNLLPKLNKDLGLEPFAELLMDLDHFEIVDLKGLTELIKAHFPAALVAEEKELAHLKENPDELAESSSRARLASGVYFSHVGLTRICLSEAFGEAWQTYNRRRRWRGSSS
jgi:hypothetical protein